MGGGSGAVVVEASYGSTASFGSWMQVRGTDGSWWLWGRLWVMAWAVRGGEGRWSEGFGKDGLAVKGWRRRVSFRRRGG